MTSACIDRRSVEFGDDNIQVRNAFTEKRSRHKSVGYLASYIANGFFGVHNELKELLDRLRCDRARAHTLEHILSNDAVGALKLPSRQRYA